MASYNVFSVVFVFSMLGLGHILISDLVDASLLMYSFPGMIPLYLAMPFLHQRCFWMIYTCSDVARLELMVGPQSTDEYRLKTWESES